MNAIINRARVSRYPFYSAKCDVTNATIDKRWLSIMQKKQKQYIRMRTHITKLYTSKAAKNNTKSNGL